MKKLKHVLSLIKENKSILSISIFLLIILSVCLVFMASGSWHDFGLNLLTELIGIVVTYFIIEKLLKLKEKKEREPLYIAMLMDVHQYLSKNVEIWSRAFGATIKRKGPLSYGDLFSKETFDEIYERLNVDEEAILNHDNLTWRKWFFEVGTNNEDSGNRVIDRYANIIESEKFVIIHTLVNSSIFSKKMCMVNCNDLILIQNSPLKSCLFFFKDEHLKMYKELCEWYEKEFNFYYKKQLIEERYRLNMTMSEYEEFPRHRLSDEDVENYKKEFDDYLRKK